MINDPETVNAYAVPGDKVAVYTGIFGPARDEAGLAVVLGHEVAHALARHPAERMSQGMFLQLGGVGLGSRSGGIPRSPIRCCRFMAAARASASHCRLIGRRKAKPITLV